MFKVNNPIERNSFNELLFDLISDYISEPEIYGEEPVLSVSKHGKKIEILSANEAKSGWNIYPINSYIRLNEETNEPEADIDATLDLADQFYFLR